MKLSEMTDAEYIKMLEDDCKKLIEENSALKEENAKLQMFVDDYCCNQDYPDLTSCR